MKRYIVRDVASGRYMACRPDGHSTRFWAPDLLDALIVSSEELERWSAPGGAWPYLATQEWIAVDPDTKSDLVRLLGVG